ncbi:hypothetical protein VDG1235_682 [Verrucomicrobiia bacterium DG1235]|nr:hypothetical protein VDG1235_682 [Verrucomicrobiae bacterium DG1235]
MKGEVGFLLLGGKTGSLGVFGWLFFTRGQRRFFSGEQAILFSS